MVLSKEYIRDMLERKEKELDDEMEKRAKEFTLKKKSQGSKSNGD